MSGKLLAWLSAILVVLLCNTSHAVDSEQFISQELPTKLTVGYAVRSIDVNQDKLNDIAIVDSKRVLWLQAPDWVEHVVYETPDAMADNVCFAPHDINQDGLIDFALGSDWQPNNTNSGGAIGWLEQRPTRMWTYHEIAKEPTTHRMHWFQKHTNSPMQLVVAPLKGKGTKAPGFDQSGVRLTAFTPSVSNGNVTWTAELITDELPVMHNFRGVDLDQDGKNELLTASFAGVTKITFDDVGTQLIQLGSGQTTVAPSRGASEIGFGRTKSCRF